MSRKTPGLCFLAVATMGPATFAVMSASSTWLQTNASFAAVNRGVESEKNDVVDFTRAELLRRFDKNRNDQFEVSEKRSLRAAFGGIDVPVLPTTPFDYSAVDRPAHILPGLISESDNTPKTNPTTNLGATLGRVLFYDKQLSRNNTIACASCHLQERAFADPRRVSTGFAGKKTRRNAMGLINLRYSNLKGSRPGFFWDERAPTLEAQILMPIQDPVEMGMSLDRLEQRLQRLPYYPALFEAAFGSTRVTRDRISAAIAQFLRAIESWNSRFDQAADAAGELANYSDPFPDLTPEENLGKSLFFNGVDGIAEFGCAHCHLAPTFGMAKSLNNGLDLRYSDPGLGAVDSETNDPFTPSNDGKFKAPSLRSVELTAPYMHDGRFNTLGEVIDHYGQGVKPHENLALAFPAGNSPDPPDGYHFSKKQKAGLIAFLKTLTDSQYTSDPKFSDPFVRLDN